METAGRARAGRTWILIQLLALLLLLGASFGARADDCSTYPNATLDGAAGTPAPTQLNIDTNCTVKNYTNFGSNFNFSPTSGPWLVIFDNVIHTGEMACNAVQQNKIWFVNGSQSQKLFANPQCQNKLIPVEKIDKQSPGAYASVGVPFTYRLVIPILYDPATGTVVPVVGSDNDLHTVVIKDDLGATGVDLSVVGTPTVTWIGSGAPVTHTYTNVGNVLTFTIDPTNTGVQIPAGQQIAIDITVVLNNNPPVNTLGKVFRNTAEWSFGRAIDLNDDGILTPDEYFSPLPGDHGISPSMVIAGPNLVMTKSGTSVLGAPSLNLGEWGVFALDVQNTGQFAAWNVTVLDLLPDGPSVGMCDMTPEITGVTLGGLPLTEGTQYTLAYTAAPACELRVELLDAAGPLAPGAHLVVNYRTKLDANSQNGTTLTNVAGATRWFNDASTNATRVQVDDPLTNGTPGTADNEDAHTLSVLLSGYFFEKTVRNVTTGANPAVQARPGEVLHYTLRLQATDTGFSNATFRDQMPPDFVPGSLNFTSLPPGVTNNSNPATGLVDIRGINVPPGTAVSIGFDVTLLATLNNGHIVQNQAQLLDAAQSFFADSDDPTVGGQANPDPAVDDEDPTRVRIYAPPSPPIKVLLTPASGNATVGEELVYRIAVPGAPRNTPMFDVSVSDLFDARLEYISATVNIGGVVDGPGVTNTSTASQLAIAIDQIGAGQQALIEVHARVRNVLAAQQGMDVANTAFFTYAESPGGAAEPVLTSNTAMVHLLEPQATITKVADRTIAVAGDVIRYTVTLTAATGADASTVFDVALTDSLSAGLVYAGNPVVSGAGDTIAAPTITGDGSPGAPQILVWSLAGGNADIDIAPGESVQVSYDVRVLATVLADQDLINSAVARWTGIDGASTGERTGADGIGGLNDYATAPATTTITTPGARPSKVLTSPTQPFATVGQEVVYTIVLPSAPSSGTLYNVAVTDPLDANLEYVSASVTGVAGAVDTSTAQQMNLAFAQIPAGQQATIELHARVRNLATTQQGVQVSNTVSYSYATSAGGPARPPLASAAVTFGIIEPAVAVAKTGNTVAVSGGDIVRYTVTLTAAGGADTSDAFDVGLVDTLAAGLVYAGNPVVSGAGNSIGAPVITGNGSAGSPQRLAWSLADANADIDIAPGTAVTVSYDVRVLNGPAALLSLANSVNAQWTGLDGDSVYERTGAGCPAIVQPNDYCAGPALHTVVVDPPRLTFYKTVLSGATAHPGDVVRYRLALTNESDVTFSGFTLRDELDALNDPAMFVPGTLTLVSALPPGATNGSNPAGGARGTGQLELGNLTLGPVGSPNSSLTVEFTAQLVPVIANATRVLNQAQVVYAGVSLQSSDDPDQAGTADPTPVLIQSAPVFQVKKVSYDVTGDPALLLPGETLRYVITVRNIGNAIATDTLIRDQVPANTRYVAGSTTLNAAPVADVGGISPLSNGMPIRAPTGATPGAVPADVAGNPLNVATITFEVRVEPATAAGTVISNQGFVTALAGGVVDTPSDDPDTAIANDPTRDVVGDYPILFADKRAALLNDLGSPGIVDAGDTLRYTITVYNNGTAPATMAVLRDQVPVNTTYVADSLTLNGLAVGRPDGGVSPLIAGVPISSSDRTPPLPGAGQGVISVGSYATVQFDLRVNAGVPNGTVISNQAGVYSTEVPLLRTDGDGNPATGPEPTLVVVGPSQRVTITKQAAVVGGGPALPGSELEYVVTVRNVGAVPATYVTITDDLNATMQNYLAYVDQSATLNAATTGISVDGQVITANYYAVYGDLAPGATAVLRFRARIAMGLPVGTRIVNTGVVAWNDPKMTATASVAVDVGAIFGVGLLSGRAWHDANFNATPDAAERLLQGWTVALYRSGQLVHSTLTDATGAWQMSGIAPNYLTLEPLELRFTAPGAGTATAKLGRADSVFTDDLQRIYEIVVQPGSNLPNLNLPIEPNGVVYESMSRRPIPGARLRLLDARNRAPLPSSCLYDPAQQGQVTLPYGYYRFDLNFADPACPSGGDYLIETTPPSDDYLPGTSELIPPTSDVSTAAFSVPTCPAGAADAVPGTALRCEVQPSEFAPAVSVPPRSTGTNYHLHLLLDDSLVPGSSQIFNNHIPLDLDLSQALAITKTTPLLEVTRGQLVPYTITLRNVGEVALRDVHVVDSFPAGFRYVPGSARIDKAAAEPVLVGRQLTWSGVDFALGEQRSVSLLLAVGAGVSEGEFVNRARSFNGPTNRALSGEATATVRVVPDPTFDCTDVLGKVFDDTNRNGRQDLGERGIGGVRLVSARGLAASTDAYGRYHITCAITPREDRGSNFVLKLDDRTLPSGFRPSTDLTRVARATRGKALTIDFGASVHHVVSLDLFDEVFEPGTTAVRMPWQERLPQLLVELKKAPAVLRLTYLADMEEPRLVEARLKAIKAQVQAAWPAAGGGYRLEIEPQVFWRRGAPVQRPAGSAGAVK